VTSKDIADDDRAKNEADAPKIAEAKRINDEIKQEMIKHRKQQEEVGAAVDALKQERAVVQERQVSHQRHQSLDRPAS
jgi:hypothetical protein